MFSKLIFRNSKRNRKDNGLFFSSMLICIVAFYIILSLKNQDVMIFLEKMESDAISRLLSMIPILYAVTLFLLFFLIYYAGKIQLEKRKHELGIYLILGMRRSKLFVLLLLEDIQGSMMALLVGLPIAIFLSEMISLVTARVVGLGIIGHQFSVSGGAILWTAIGFFLVKLVAFLLLGLMIARQQIGNLLAVAPDGARKQLPKGIYVLAVFMGAILLAKAYYMGISGQSWRDFKQMGMTMIFGLAGTLLLFFGLRVVIGFLIQIKRNRRLYVYNFRQIEEAVIYSSGKLAISSLLVLAGLGSFGAGVAVGSAYLQTVQHISDYTFTADYATINHGLISHHLDSYFSDLFEVKIGLMDGDNQDKEELLQMKAVLQELEKLPKTKEQTILLKHLRRETRPYLISLSGYNELQRLAGQPILKLKEEEVVIYQHPDFTFGKELLNHIFAQKPQIFLNGENHYITGKVESLPLVTDRAITLAFALIVPDNKFETYTKGNYEIFLNGSLKSEWIQQKGLMGAVLEVNQKLTDAGIEYESYLQNMGRQLFYSVATSYLTIYLAIIFLVIANTMIGVQFLVNQQKSKKRLKTLIHLGADYQILCQSAKKQINWYFGLPVLIALISSQFGVRALLTGLLPGYLQQDLMQQLLISGIMIVFLGVMEYIYMILIKHFSNRYIFSLMEPERSE
ncbi:ABC transporter permease [Clostridiales bacterium COT073_COT-073]|nr:ABC transporter permease [Clostridiales bacterium COT073_COT-073]